MTNANIIKDDIIPNVVDDVLSDTERDNIYSDPWREQSNRLS